MNSNCSTTTTTRNSTTTTTTTNSTTKSSRSSCYNRSKATKITTNSNSNYYCYYCYYCYYRYSNSFSSSSSRLSLRLSTRPLSSSTRARVFSSRRTSTPRPSRISQTLETSSSLPIVSTFASSIPYSRTCRRRLVLTRTRTSSGWTKNIADTFCSSSRVVLLCCAFLFPTKAPCFCACLG